MDILASVNSPFAILIAFSLPAIMFTGMLTLVLRSLKSWNRERGVALLAAAALAVGIGSATAIFTIVDAVLLKPLPYSEGSRWVAILGGDTHDPNHYSGLTWADCEAYQQRLQSLEVFGWFPVGGDFNLTTAGQSRHVNGIEISPSLLAHSGAIPVTGRFFNSSDGADVALISNRLLGQLGRGIVGSTIRLNGEPHTVVGAMPAWFRMPIVTVYSRDSDNDVWVPLKRPPDEEHARNYAFYETYGKLKPGVSIAQARAEAIRVGAEVRKLNHPNDPNYTAAFFSLAETVAQTIRPILLLLFGAAALLLLITCANVAGLLVSRSVGRARETAIQIALGGSQMQLAIQYFLEGGWVSLTAAAGGLLLSVVFVRALLALAADYIPRSQEVTVAWTAGLFAIGMAVLTATLSALAPLWQAFRTAPNQILSSGVRASAGARSRGLSQVLVVAEITLAFTLISAGALLLWEFRSLTRTSPGFDPNGLLTFQVTRPNPRAFAEKLVTALGAIPGVANAAVANQIPLAGCCFSTSLFPQRREARAETHDPVSLMLVSPEYFKTLRIPLLAGRLLNEHDTNSKLLPVVIDQAAAERYWAKQDAIGALANLGGQAGSAVQVVGIVGTVKNNKLGQPPTPEIYLNSQNAPPEVMTFIVRSPIGAADLIAAIHRAVADVDPSQPIYAVQAMDEVISGSLIFEKIEWIVVTFFALAALLMACLGVYGLTSYSVRQRTTELGTRLALGATGGQLLKLITREGLKLAIYGVVIGIVTVAGATQLVAHYLNVHHLNAVPYLLSLLIVLAVALLASLVPGWRASLLSPMVAIRNDSESMLVSVRRALEMARQRVLPAKDATAFDSTLLTEFIEASRRADSFAEAFQACLMDLSGRIHSSSALLLEQTSMGQFRTIASTGESGLATRLAIPENGFLLNRLRFYAAPMSFSAADLETSLRWAVEQKPQQAAELALLQKMELRLAAPLRTKNELIGLLVFGPHEMNGEYSSAEKNLVAACGEQFALTVENARLTERVLEQDKVRRDISLATEVQRRLLPESSPQTAVTSLGAYTLAARSIGGDYYDFFQTGDHTIGIALADVAGKGIAAALIMAVVQTSLRIITAEEKISLPALAAKLNKFLHKSTGVSGYATFFYAQFDEEKRQLRYVNAGHNPPYLVRAGHAGPIEELTAGGMIIGMFPAASYEEAVVDLHAGDVMLAFTDGVTEALNAAGDEFGEERLQELVREAADLPIVEMTASISQRLREWIGEAPQHDDITFVVMKVT